MKITGVRWQGYRLPFRREFVTSTGGAHARFGLVLFVQTDDGLAGIGEASPVGAGSREEIDTIAGTLSKLMPLLLRQDIETAEQIGMLSTIDVPAPVRFGLETALLDLRGQETECPLVSLLGGKPVSVDVNAIIAAGTAEQAAAEATEAVAEGFKTLKLKVGRERSEDDERLVVSVREAVGVDIKLRLDPNQAWSVDRAVEALRRLARFDIEYVEQPVAAADVDGMAEVRRSVPVPIAADEALGSLADLRRLLAAEAADVFILKAARLGGISAALEIAKTALAAGRRVVVTSSLESGVGVAAGLHLAAAMPSDMAHGLATVSLFTEDLTATPLLPERGKLQTPILPGLGVTVNGAMLRKYGIGIIGSVGSHYDLPD